VELAETQVTSARSAALPQVNGSLNCTRTSQSLSGGSGAGFHIPDPLRFEPDCTASMAQRIRFLEPTAPNTGL
jgi:hypothetical protein